MSNAQTGGQPQLEDKYLTSLIEKKILSNNLIEMEDLLEDFIKRNSVIYKKIIRMLDTDQCWKQVVDSLETYCIPVYFSDFDLDKMERSQSPSKILLSLLLTRQCPVYILCDILRNCNLLNVLSLISPPEPLMITKQPVAGNETVYVMPGGELTLECEAVGLPPPSYLWHYFNTELQDQTQPTLCLSEFTEDDVGEYYCVISQSEEKSITTNIVNVELLPEAPTFIKDLKIHETVAQNGNITLSVDVQARPPPAFEWMFQNQIIPGQTSSKLRIKKAKVAHEGRYRCVATNHVGSVTSTPCAVRVYSPPNQATAKMALLIATEEYDHLSKLITPSNDALSLARILKELGFHVFTLHNLTLVEMRNAITWFYSLLPPNAYALVYFAGHGFEFGDKYMMPVDCPMDNFCRKDCFCNKELIQLGMKASPRLLVILLDMCLKNPSIENEKIHKEKMSTYPYEYGNCDLVEGTATSSHLNAYEESKSEHGLYVKHLSKHLAEDESIVNILQKTHEEFKKYDQSKLQKPGVFYNISSTYKLTDSCDDDKKFNHAMTSLTDLSMYLKLDFTKVKLKPDILLRHHRGCFLNSVDLVFPLQLRGWQISAEVNSELNCYSWWKEATGELVLTIHDIQKAKVITSVCATIKLNEKLGNGSLNFVDYCTAELPCPIFQQSLWFEKSPQ